MIAITHTLVQIFPVCLSIILFVLGFLAISEARYQNQIRRSWRAWIPVLLFNGFGTAIIIVGFHMAKVYP